MKKNVSSLSSSNKPKLLDRAAGDLIDILRRAVPDLNAAEAKVARIILSNSEWVVHAPIKAVAQQAEAVSYTHLTLPTKA